MPSPLFFSTSSEKPKLLKISFASDPKSGLGAQLTNHDKENPNDMFVPAFAGIGRLLDGNTIARRAGVAVGDSIVAVNGTGFRRFAPDFDETELENVSALPVEEEERSSSLATAMEEVDLGNGNDNGDVATTTPTTNNINRVLSHLPPGDSYKSVVAEIKKIKSSPASLLLTLERFDWDARANSWSRFLVARDGNVPEAMQMLQTHEAWRDATFPIDLTDPNLQTVLRSQAVSKVDLTTVSGRRSYPTVYVNFGKLQSIGSGGVRAADVSRAFVVFTEELLQRAKDPRSPKACQFIDLTGVSFTGGIRSDVLREIYGTFEPNYPETLQRMIMYPVSKYVASTAKMLLSFVNANTKKKFLITDDLSVVCKELGWSQTEVEACGGVTSFMEKHNKAGSSLVFNN